MADTVSAEAEARVRQMAEVAESHDVNFSGADIIVQPGGDYTSISTGSTHPGADSLYAAVCRIVDYDEVFDTDGEDFGLVPLPSGGVARVRL